MERERAERFHLQQENLERKEKKEKGRKEKERKNQEKTKEKKKRKREKLRGEEHGSKGEREREVTAARRGRGKAPRATTGSREPPSPPPSSVTR